MRSLLALRQVLEIGCGALVIPEQIAVSRAADAYDEMDHFKDERTAELLRSCCAPSHRYGKTICVKTIRLTEPNRDN